VELDPERLQGVASRGGVVPCELGHKTRQQLLHCVSSSSDMDDPKTTTTTMTWQYQYNYFLDFDHDWLRGSIQVEWEVSNQYPTAHTQFLEGRRLDLLDRSLRDDHTDQYNPLNETFSVTGKQLQDAVVVDAAVVDFETSKSDLDDDAAAVGAEEVSDLLVQRVDYFVGQMPRRMRTAETLFHCGVGQALLFLSRHPTPVFATEFS
jgi:hypothetical protein